MFASDALLVDGDPVPRPRLDKGQNGIDACYRLYETQEGWIQIAALTDAAWEGLCAAVGAAELAADERFATRAARAENRRQLESLLEPRFATRTAIQWTRVLDALGVPNEVAFDTKAGEYVLFDGDNERLDLVAEYDHALLGRMRQFGSLIDFSETPGLVHGPPPMVGEHTVEILEWLGIDAPQRDELKAEAVVYWPDDNYGWTN
jgi:crotonobetainyl-CoA:carnitine CoA-transferase CaiB-like acyl-CoA transferase